jgi:chaperonin GroEL
MRNKLLFGDEMINKMKAGMWIVYQAVSATMGAAGKNALYRSDYSGRPVATNDGITIARRIALEDEAAAMGAELLTQAAERTNEEAGDGTTTAIVLTYAMVEEGLKKIEEGKNPMVLRREMQDSVTTIVSRLKELSIPVETDEQLFNIANISMENPEIAKVIAESVKKVGENGIVLVEESSGIAIERKDVDGFKFNKGYITPYMATDPATMESVLTDVPVLVTNKSFQLNKDLFPILEALVSMNIKKLFVVCSGMQGELLSSVITNRMQGKFNCVVVEKPYDEESLEDIAVVTGAELIDEAKNPTNAYMNSTGFLGKAEKIIVTKDSTLIVGGKGDKEKIDERVKSIKKEIAEIDGTSYQKEKLKERLAKLTGGVIIIKVGASTEAEMKYLKLKVDDAVASTRSAIEEGIVIGGGKTLFDLSKEPFSSDGDEVVKISCRVPRLTIEKNAGYSGGVDEDGVFNALTNKVTNTPIEDGIIDPTKVERCALQNAVSLAGIFLTTESVIVDIPNKKESPDVI